MNLYQPLGLASKHCPRNAQRSQMLVCKTCEAVTILSLKITLAQTASLEIVGFSLEINYNMFIHILINKNLMK